MSRRHCLPRGWEKTYGVTPVRLLVIRTRAFWLDDSTAGRNWPLAPPSATEIAQQPPGRHRHTPWPAERTTDGLADTLDREDVLEPL